MFTPTYVSTHTHAKQAHHIPSLQVGLQSHTYKMVCLFISSKKRAQGFEPRKFYLQL